MKTLLRIIDDIEVPGTLANATLLALVGLAFIAVHVAMVAIGLGGGLQP